MNEEATSSHVDRILIVDDTTANLQLLTTILMEQGYTVHPASDGALALEFVRSTLPDLILLDIRMPEMDGYEVCRRLKADARTRSIPIIFISILEEQLDKVKAFQAGGVDYISKPFHPEEVIARVQAHLMLRRMQKDLEHRNAELKLARSSLEDRVRERTAELSQANANLKEEIVDRKRAEEALRDSERRLQEAQRIAHIGYWERNFDVGRIILSDEACSIFGLSPQEFPLNLEKWHLHWLELIHPEDQLRASQAAADALGDGPPYRLEYRIVRPDGEVRWIHSEANVKRDESGRPHCMLGMMQDITERKRAEEALQEKTEELDRYFASALDLLCIADTDGCFRRLNPQWEATLGYPVADLEGRRFLDFVHPDDMQQTLHAISRLSEQQEVLNFVNRYRNKSGAYRWIEWRSFPSGKRIYAVARDITDRKRAEDEIRKLNQELEQRVAVRTAQLEAANRELEAFAYSVSHDLRAPLRHIDGFVELLRQRTASVLDEQSRRYLGNISDSVGRMGMLIDDLLTFSRMGRHTMSQGQVDLGALTQEVIGEISPDAQGRIIRWRVAELPVVTGDAAMLRIVLINLIANAVKFTRPREQADIEIGCIPGQATETVVFIRDNGVGFDMTYAHKLFGVFQRLHRAEEFEGTGIGLANVRRIINRHGGRTWAEGKLDQGATFFFSLP